MKLKLKRKKQKIKEIEQQKKIKTTKIPAKQVSQKEKISNYIRKIWRTKKYKFLKHRHKLKEEEQTENRKQLKGDDTEKNI